MSEIFVKNLDALQVSQVDEPSPAFRAGVARGDILKSINGHPILDILDFRFHSSEAQLNLQLERNGSPLELRVRKRIEEDLGLQFESDLGDKIHTCKNKCVFCFIHQQPKKMRKSLYLMDDDFRLSFMHGNYVTLTNLSDAEWARILEQRLSPLYVSVHATDPSLRATLLGRREDTPILPQLEELATNRISVHAQVVLCPGLNDSEALDNTLRDLASLHPAVTGKRAGVESVAIVPVGMTRYRERLAPLVHVERDTARAILRQVETHARAFHNKLGTRFVWLGDEWYHLAETRYPGRRHYEDFPQLEDGIGTMRLFLDDLAAVSRRLPVSVPVPVNATVVTATLPAPVVRQMAARFSAVLGVSTNVCVVENEFFGGDIHIAGLLTWQDIYSHLNKYTTRHDTIYIPDICLKDHELFLDDVTIQEARQLSGMDLRITGNRPRDLAADLGLVRKARSQGFHPAQVMEETPTA